MTQIGELTVKITAESGEFVGTLKLSNAAVQNFAKGVKEGAKETGVMTENLKKGNKETAKQGEEFKKFAVVTALVVAGFAALNKIYQETTGLAINQAMAQKDLARQMGTTVVEAGILKEISDDLRVSQETLVFAFKALNEKGLQPNFETLIKLAKEYQALPNSIAKNQFAVDLFGKSGIEMQKILDTNVTTLNEMYQSGQKTGKVLSEEGVNALEDYRLALDDVTDSVEGLKTQMGLAIALMTVDFIKGVPLIIQSWVRIIALQNEGKLAMREGIITEQQYWDMFNLKISWNSDLQEDSYKITQRLMALKGQYAGINEMLGKSYGIVADEQSKKIDFDKKEFEEYQKINKAVENNNLYFQQQIQNTRGLTTDIIEFNRRMAERIRLTGELTAIQDKLKDAQKDLSDVQDNWNKSVGADSLAYLKDYVYNYGPKYTEALKTNDEVWGTSSAVQYARNRALKDANAEYAKTGDLEAYKKKLTEIKDTYGPMDDAITAAKDAVLLLKDAMDRLVDKIIHIDIITKYSYVQPTPGHPDVPSYPTPGHKEGDPAGGENYWHWNGIAWVVIHGYQHGGPVRAGESILVGERGPELFTPSIAGNITNNYYSNLTIHSNARTEQVASSFELMRSLNSPGV